MKKILILVLAVALALGALTSCEDILSKIPGLGGDDHVCESPCERCGKCTDLECESKACSNKCYGHIIPPAAHKCESACPECGKCTNASCSNTVCKENAQDTPQAVTAGKKTTISSPLLKQLRLLMRKVWTVQRTATTSQEQLLQFLTLPTVR